MNITTKQLKDLFIKFFKSHDHVQIASASLVPENDSSVLFTTAGMHPLVPYLLGKSHPQGKRLVNYQKCVRTNDIDEVGDASHLTFFEMLGTWSLGDYYKKEALEYSFEFLTGKDWLNIPLEKLAVSCFAGDENSPKDEFSYNKWKELGIDENNIFYLPAEHNWWALGEVGPCGPDSEMFYITNKEKCSDNCSPACDCGRYLEIWNDVFMGYVRKKEGQKIEELASKNIDTGMGLERTVCVLNGYDNVYEIDSLKQAIIILEKLSRKSYTKDSETTKAMRIISDHLRAATMILGDEQPTLPSNVGGGYVLRRLIRRSVNFARRLDINPLELVEVVSGYIDFFASSYDSLEKNRNLIINEFKKEIDRFSKTITNGLKEFEKVKNQAKDNKIDGGAAFRLYDTFGFPLELTIELAKEAGLLVDEAGYNAKFAEHQEKSRASAQVFKGGLAGTDEVFANYHTATHLLLAALRKHYGDDILQRGSNITASRMRFDFNFPRKMERDELDIIQNQVNEWIDMKMDVSVQEMPLKKARELGAIGIFNDKYGDNVMVYSIGDISKEFCGGPHAKNTAQLGEFIIKKEESSSAGVRRIRAELKTK